MNACRVVIAAIAVVACVSVGCGSGTYVVLTFEPGQATPAGISQLDITAILAGRAASASYSRGGAEIELPTTAALAIGSGSGDIEVRALARDASGQLLDSGFGSGAVVRGDRSDVRVRFGRLSVDDNAVDYGSVPVGSSSVRMVTVSNKASEPIGPLVTTVDGDFAIRDDGCATQLLMPGMQCVIAIAFAPNSAGKREGTFIVRDSDDAAFASLTGVGLPSVTLTVNIVGPGSGSAKASVEGFTCVGNTCSVGVPLDETSPQAIILTPLPDYRSSVVGWSAGCSGVGDCSLLADGNKSVTLTFGLRPPSLTVRVVGSGRVASVDGLIDCGAGGSKCGPVQYQDPNTVTLVATGSGGSQLIGWGGGTSTCPKAAVGGCRMDPCTGIICAPGEECQSGICVPGEPLCASIACPALTRCVQGTCIGQADGCSGPLPSCTMNVSPDLALTATFGPSRDYVFTTSATYPLATLGGLTGIDAKCQQAAQALYLPGTYKAWLSTTSVAAKTRVGTGGWYRTDGRVFATTLADLTGMDRQMYYPLRIDQAGNDFGLVPIDIATATYSTGDASFNNCVDFTNSNASIDLGSSTGGESIWTENGVLGTSCATPQHLYCFRSDGTAGAIPLPGTAGRRVFITKASFDPSTGVTAADALCASEAASAGLTSNTGFVAFLATPTASAASRLDLSPGTQTFTLVDGVVLFERPFDLFIGGGRLLVTADLPADGSAHLRKVVWTGASDPNQVGTLASTCNGWTTKSMTATGTQGFERDASSKWFSGLDAACSFPAASVLCFER